MESPLEFAGAVGRTRSETVQFRCPDGSVVAAVVHRAVNVATDPELARKFLDEDPKRALNRVESGESSLPVNVSVVYHDPKHQLLVLVLPDSERHLELVRRSELLLELNRSDAPVPDYAANFDTVFGVRGLKELLKSRAERKLHERQGQPNEAAERKLADRARELDEREQSLDNRAEALDRRAAAVEKRSVELSRARASERDPAKRSGRIPAPDRAATVTEPLPRFGFAELDPITTSPGDSVSSIRPSGTEVNVSVTDLALEHQGEVGDADRTQKRVGPDAALDRWLASDEPVLAAADPSGLARLAIAGSPEELSQLRSEHLQIKLQLHRLPGAALPTLAVAPTGVLDDPKRASAAWMHVFDLEDVATRRLLEGLASEFRLALDLYTADRQPVGRRLVTADLEDNVSYLLSAADAYTETLAADQRSVGRARIALDDPKYDRFGLRHPERPSFRDDKLRALGRPSAVLSALSVARRFSKPEREDYLVLTRGYSLSRWRQRRRLVLARALELGLWIGPRLLKVAIRDGIAPSPQILVQTLVRNFGELVSGGGHGLDEKAVEDNWHSLREEPVRLGITSRRADPISSESEPQVSGTIGEAPQAAPEGKKADPRVADLSDKDKRLEAALELTEAAEPATLEPLFAAIGQMTRGEAGRVLGTVPRFGEPAVPHLIEGLKARKGFVRQGCALALGVVGGERATEALADLLVTEPTEIWREVARAIGCLGGSAAPVVVARARTHTQHKERIAWALANISVGEGAKVVESLARGRDSLASELASQAAEMRTQARSEDAAVKAANGGREVTVNRAFSRRFFEALGDPAPEPVAGELSAPAMMLDDSDLLDATDLDDEGHEPLDEGDLIPT